MCGTHLLLERSGVEAPWFTTGLALDQRSANGFDFRAAFLLAPDQVADVLAVVGVMTGVDLCLDPAVLLLGQGDGFADGAHGLTSLGCVGGVINSHHWCIIAQGCA